MNTNQLVVAFPLLLVLVVVSACSKASPPHPAAAESPAPQQTAVSSTVQSRAVGTAVPTATPTAAALTPKSTPEIVIDRSKSYPIAGKVVQKVEGEGILVYRGPDQTPTMEPDVILLTGYAQEANVVDGDQIPITQAWAAGTFNYVATSGARKTVRRYMAQH